MGCFIGACAPLTGRAPSGTTPEPIPSGKESELVAIGAPCSRDDAREWADAAAADGWSALRAANCYAFLVTTGTDGASRLADAKAGRELAEGAVQRFPDSGLAHYLYAYLAGLEAENDPLHGLEWVPVIEREARLASDLNASLDHGGPDRMLGELYLRAPGIPLSIGDGEKAVIHYRRALTLAPDFPGNRLGLIEALLKTQETNEACNQLHRLMADMPPRGDDEAAWQKALDLLKRLCAAAGAE